MRPSWEELRADLDALQLRFRERREAVDWKTSSELWDGAFGLELAMGSAKETVERLRLLERAELELAASPASSENLRVET